MPATARRHRAAATPASSTTSIALKSPTSTPGRPQFKWSQYGGGLVGRGHFDNPSKQVTIKANLQAITNSGLPSFYLEALEFDAAARPLAGDLRRAGNAEQRCPHARRQGVRDVPGQSGGDRHDVLPAVERHRSRHEFPRHRRCRTTSASSSPSTPLWPATTCLATTGPSPFAPARSRTPTCLIDTKPPHGHPLPSRAARRPDLEEHPGRRSPDRRLPS